MYIAPPLDALERSVRQEIESLNNELGAHLRQPNRWAGELRRTTLARNVQGSNTIEGIHATVDEINAIAAGEKSSTIDNDTAQALLGYQQAMTYVLQLAQSEFDVNPMLVRSLHFMITQHDMTKWPGRFRPGPVCVQQAGTGDIVHEGAAADDVPALMVRLCDSFGSEPDILIHAAMLHLNFVLMHPFKDGNGRLARVLQSLAVASSGEFAPIFLTIEEYLGRRTQAYYDVLAQVGQGDWGTADYDPELARPWIRFVLTAHLNQALERAQRIASASEAATKLDELIDSHGLPERTLQALYIAMFGGTVTRSRYLAALADAGEDVTEQTASRDLASLARAGVLVARGDKRGRSYVSSDEVLRIARDAGLGYAWKDIDPFDE